MDYILEAVPFTNCEEEPRLHAMIKDLIEKGEVPEYKSFTEEEDKKKLRRKRKVRMNEFVKISSSLLTKLTKLIVHLKKKKASKEKTTTM